MDCVHNKFSTVKITHKTQWVETFVLSVMSVIIWKISLHVYAYQMVVPLPTALDFVYNVSKDML